GRWHRRCGQRRLLSHLGLAVAGKVLIASFHSDLLAAQSLGVAVEPGEIGNRPVRLRRRAQSKHVHEALRELTRIVVRQRQRSFRLAQRQQQTSRLRPLADVSNQIDHTPLLTGSEQHARKFANDFFLRRAELERALQRALSRYWIAQRQVGTRQDDVQACIVRRSSECFDQQTLRTGSVVRCKPRFSSLQQFLRGLLLAARGEQQDEASVRRPARKGAPPRQQLQPALVLLLGDRRAEDARTLRRLDALRFLVARAAENAFHRVVALVAGVFVHVFLARVEAHLGAPRLRVIRRVLDRELVVELVGRSAAEALGHLALIGQEDRALLRLL